MKKITIGFSRPKKWNLLSYLIMKVQKTEYSHVYIKFYSSSLDREIIYQASGLQVNFVGSEIFNKNHVTVKTYDLHVDDETYKNALVFAVDKAGISYSMKQLFHILGYMLTGKTSFFNKNLDGYVCSELAAEMLKDELNLPISENLNLIIPRDIDQLLEKHYGKTQ